MQNDQLVSVIMPAFNADRNLLFTAIKSIGSQTYSAIELIIADDGSTEPVSDYFDIRDNGLTVKIVRTEDNKGIAHARNHAISIASGKWLVWLDADDTLDANCIETLLKETQQYSLVIGECLVAEGNRLERRQPKFFIDKNRQYVGTKKDPFLLNIISLQPQLILRSDFWEVGGLDESYRYAELTEFFLRFLVKKGIDKIGFAENAVYHYDRNRKDSLTSHREELFAWRVKALSAYKEIILPGSASLIYSGRDKRTGFQKYILPNKNNNGNEN